MEISRYKNWWDNISKKQLWYRSVEKNFIKTKRNEKSPWTKRNEKKKDQKKKDQKKDQKKFFFLTSNNFDWHPTTQKFANADVVSKAREKEEQAVT